MQGKNRECTLWTNSMEGWTQLLEDVHITAQVKEEISQAAENLAADASDRLRPYDAPITQEALSRAVT